jgi:hypothetical protein
VRLPAIASEGFFICWAFVDVRDKTSAATISGSILIFMALIVAELVQIKQLKFSPERAA